MAVNPNIQDSRHHTQPMTGTPLSDGISAAFSHAEGRTKLLGILESRPSPVSSTIRCHAASLGCMALLSHRAQTLQGAPGQPHQAHSLARCTWRFVLACTKNKHLSLPAAFKQADFVFLNGCLSSFLLQATTSGTIHVNSHVHHQDF